MKIKEMIKGYEGQYVILTESEKFYGHEPIVEKGTKVVYKAETKPSYGYNGGAYVFNSGEGYAILTCSKELANELVEQLRGKVPSDACVPFYNASVWYDDAQRRIARMAAACGK